LREKRCSKLKKYICILVIVWSVSVTKRWIFRDSHPHTTVHDRFFTIVNLWDPTRIQPFMTDFWQLLTRETRHAPDRVLSYVGGYVGFESDCGSVFNPNLLPLSQNKWTLGTPYINVYRYTCWRGQLWLVHK
jgi:hypothetical protein